MRIEIKEFGIEKNLVNLIEKYGMLGNVVCISFNLKSVSLVRKLNSSIPVSFITGAFSSEKIGELLEKNINMLDIEFHNLSLPLLKNCHTSGFVVEAWTIDNREDMKKFLDMGVEIIATNYPQRLKKILEK